MSDYSPNALAIFHHLLDEDAHLKHADRQEHRSIAGHVISINQRRATIVTHDQYKKAVGGIARNSFLIMVEKNTSTPPDQIYLLRVLESAATPMTKETELTIFELHKQTNQVIDNFTSSLLEWGGLETQILGTFYITSENPATLQFSGDSINFLSPHKYDVYSPNACLLNQLLNSFVDAVRSFPIGKYRKTECQFALNERSHPDVTIRISTDDIIGVSIALFGKTRQGKSNTMKLLIRHIIEQEDISIGQLIFDVQGEVANDNEQDNNLSIHSLFPEECVVYTLTPKSGTPSELLQVNFYQQPVHAQKILASLLRARGKTSNYIEAFLTAILPSWEEIELLPYNEKTRAKRKILFFWAVLYKAGFRCDASNLPEGFSLDPGFSFDIKMDIYEEIEQFPQQYTLDLLVRELELLVELNRQSPLYSTSKKRLLDADDLALLNFLHPTSGAGTKMIQPFRSYHNAQAGDYLTEVLDLLEAGKTVIIDLSNADKSVSGYFSEELSRAVFYHQQDKFSTNRLGNHFIQLYFEEAHEIFPKKEENTLDIYKRIAKEGAKMNMGIVYATQSPSSISDEMMNQTRVYFISHISSQKEVSELIKDDHAFQEIGEDIGFTQDVGFTRYYNTTNRFVIPIQVFPFDSPDSV